MSKMKKTPLTNWYNTNPFFDTKAAYDSFVAAMKAAAEYPIALEYEQPDTLTANDIKLFSQRFMRDTGLSIEFRLYTCRHCDRLHCLMIVDEAPEESDVI